MDSLGSLNAFVQAADTRSFTVAGRQLGVSSSAIGKAVARMEERLGVRLFHRSTRSITLTAEGALFLEHRDHGTPPRGGQRRAVVITESRAKAAEHIRHFPEPAGQAGTRSGTVGVMAGKESSGLAVAQTLLVAI